MAEGALAEAAALGRWTLRVSPPRLAALQYPEGYLEARARREKEKENSKREAEAEHDADEDGDLTPPRKGKRKCKSGGGCLCGRQPRARSAVALTRSALSPQVGRRGLGPREGPLRKARWSPTASRPSRAASSRRTRATLSCGARS